MTYQHIGRIDNPSHVARYSAQYARMRNTQQLVQSVRDNTAQRAFVAGATTAIIAVTALIAILTVIVTVA